MFIRGITELKSKVETCAEKDGKYLVSLDNTCFYAAAGGQPSDRGTINNILVEEVYKYNGETYHVLNEEVTGDVVCKVDEVLRNKYSCLHTAQHLISALFDLRGSSTSSLSLKEDVFSIDLSLSHSQEEMDEVELLANELIYKRIPVIESKYDPVTDSSLKLPDVELSSVRIIDIEGLDRNPCGGTHLNNLGELRLIKIIKSKPSRGGVRVWVTAGEDALKYLQDRYNKYQALVSTLGVEEERSLQFLTERLKSYKKYQKQLKYIKKNSDFEIEL